uniref:Uncharacterized protein n=1 Tax=Lactuca sativa TaxID=4236 RepID=A0A9R1VE19_LACSA|nr:hypothetical protein LSAT_V11C500229530 [Lactuca sativa]
MHISYNYLYALVLPRYSPSSRRNSFPRRSFTSHSPSQRSSLRPSSDLPLRRPFSDLRTRPLIEGAGYCSFSDLVVIASKSHRCDSVLILALCFSLLSLNLCRT